MTCELVSHHLPIKASLKVPPLLELDSVDIVSFVFINNIYLFIYG